MNNKGLTLFAVVVFLGIIFLLTVSLISYTISQRNTTQIIYHKNQAFNIAEAGVDKAIWCLNNPDGCAVDYDGETTTIGNGQYTSTLSSVGADYVVESTGTVNGVSKTIKTTITTTAASAAASFYYGVQVGEGGLIMSNNSFISGNLYANGNIEGGSGTYVTGNVIVAGGTQSTADQQQSTYSSDFIFRNSSSNRDIAQSFKPAITDTINYVSFYLKKNSVPGNATVRITTDNSGQPATTDLTSGTLDASQITTSYGWVDVSFTSSVELTSGSTYWIIIDNSSNHSNKYFVSGMHENSGYGNGIGLYGSDWTGGSWTDAGGDFMFKTWMGGSDPTHIDGIEVQGDAYANEILNAEVDGDAYYDLDPAGISGTTVHGTKYSGQVSQPPEALPISDGKILQWKQEAEDGGVITGDYNLNLGGTESLGPIKITGNMTISNSSTLNITGNIWVEGDVLFDNNAIIQLDPGYGTASGTLITDGQVTTQNNCVFSGSGDEKSYIMVLTTDNSLTLGDPAIDIRNNADSVIFYAGEGLIEIANNATLKEATAYELSLANGASVSYVSGLANAKFANGPGGVWETESSTWQQID